ncbi:MAG: ankyrin repeat domain-containing protein, partial [Anaerolineales bacterium]
DRASSSGGDMFVSKSDLEAITPYFKLAQVLAALPNKKPGTKSIGLLVSAHRKTNMLNRDLAILFIKLFFSLGARLELSGIPAVDLEAREMNDHVLDQDWPIFGEDGFSPMHFAAKRGDIHIAECLVSLGADIDKFSSFKITPLMVAAHYNNIAMIDFLLEKGARLALKSTDGKSIEDHIQTSEARELIRIRERFAAGPIIKDKESYLSKAIAHRCANGLLVRSKSEVIIADCLFYNGLRFEYEKRMANGNSMILPDFTITSPNSDEVIIWEHLGVDTKEYRDRWREKLSAYEKLGIKIGQNLYITEDVDGTIDSSEVFATVRRIKEKLG